MPCNGDANLVIEFEPAAALEMFFGKQDLHRPFKAVSQVGR
jgi:hypothetical protein